jgi:hypothetical protein
MRRIRENEELFPGDDSASRAAGVYLPKDREALAGRWAAAKEKGDAAGMKSIGDEAQALKNRAMGHREEFSKRNELLKGLMDSLKGDGWIPGQPEFHGDAHSSGSQHLGSISIRANRGAQNIQIVVPIGNDVQADAQNPGVQSYTFKINR